MGVATQRAHKPHEEESRKHDNRSKRAERRTVVNGREGPASFGDVPVELCAVLDVLLHLADLQVLIPAVHALLELIRNARLCTTQNAQFKPQMALRRAPERNNPASSDPPAMACMANAVSHSCDPL